MDLVILRGVQIKMAAAGFDVLLLGGLERPNLAVHRNHEPLAVRSTPPDTGILFAPAASEKDRAAISTSIDEGVDATLAIVSDVAKDAPMPGDVFAERVWRACRGRREPVQQTRSSAIDPRRVNEYVDLFRGRPHLQQIEMVLSLSERVLTGKATPPDRQIQAAAAALMWRELGMIDWGMIDPVMATRGGWLSVASLAIQPEADRRNFLDLLRQSMPLICQDDPVDIAISTKTTVRVYRFHAGQRTLIDRRGGRRGRVH